MSAKRIDPCCAKTTPAASLISLDRLIDAWGQIGVEPAIADWLSRFRTRYLELEHSDAAHVGGLHAGHVRPLTQ
ncbi:MAG TPA: hypothetical protein VHU80_06440 [Polyangiaceae bacterium]|nr:hypothetical protein [Polyangiaceae bacterium]